MHFIESYFKHYLRSGLLFRRYLRQLKESEKYSAVEFQAYQNECLRKVIKLAYEGVPFYFQTFKKLKLTPDDIRNTSDLNKLPIIDNKVVRENFALFKNRKYFGPVFKGLTSGTTGSPGVYLRDLPSINFENAAAWRSWQWGGRSFGSKRVSLRAGLIVPSDQKVPPFWKMDWFAKELIFSSHHMSESTLKLYVETIKKYRPDDLFANPSAAYLLAEFNHRHNLGLTFKVVFTSSEMLFDYQRVRIEKSFGCRVFDWYGQAERVAAIGQCEHGTYHEISDYSIVEYSPQSEGRHEIIGTTLNNLVMPLIRYRTGDSVMMEDNHSCPCGRNLKKIKNIEGRSVDALHTPDGRVVGVLNCIPRGIDHLIEMQFVQRSLHEIILRVVVSNDFSDKDAQKLIKKVKEFISYDIKFIIEKVDYIHRGKNGKFNLVISELKKPLLRG